MTALAANYPLEKLHDNPWNERPLDPENVARIAASIRADGLLQAPLGRWHPDKPGEIQLAFGHHRLAAVRSLEADWNKTSHEPSSISPWTTIPVDIRDDIDDRSMARYAIVENHSRQDPSAIEKARALLRLTGELGMTQAEAGDLFGLKQSAVSHLTRLLGLPAEVQDLVHRGEIPERAARALLPLVHWAGEPRAVAGLVKQAMGEPEDERADFITGAIDNLLQRKAQTLSDYQRPWPIAWPEKPLAFADNRKERGEPSEIPSCKGCSFAIVRDRQAYCLRKPCFDAKGRLWMQTVLADTSAKLGIPVAAPGETVSVVFNGSYSHADVQRAAKLIRAKLPELRLAPNPTPTHGPGLIDVTGTQSVILVTTGKMAVEKYLNDTKGRAVALPKPANESPAQAERRRVAEKELAEERKLERIAYNRSRADVLWLVEHTAELVAGRTVAGGGMLLFAIEENRGSFFGVTEEMRLTTEALAKLTGVDQLGHSYADGSSSRKQAFSTSTPQMDTLRRQYLAYRKLTRDVASGHNATDVYGNFKKARDTAEDVATKTFGIELPAGWDKAPIHKTPINCWTCGRFSPSASGKLTQGDIKEGWLSSTDQHGITEGVYCPEHALAHKGRPLVEALADVPPAPKLEVKQFAGKLPTKPASNKRAAAAAAARAQVLASAKRGAGHVRGHVRPAPKPSSAKKQSTRKSK